MRKIHVKHVLAIFVAGGIGSATAAEDAFIKLDRNADGFISAEESIINQDLYDNWSTVDANNDGRIDSGEFSAFEISDEKKAEQE